MKKKNRLLALALFLLVMLSVFSVSSVSATDNQLGYTNTYHMNGYGIYGYVSMTCDWGKGDQGSAAGYTICENSDYGKVCFFDYCYEYGGNEKHIYRGDLYEFKYNNSVGLFEGYKYTSQTDNPISIIGQHKVKASQHMIWSSHESEDDSYIGREPDYNDVV